MNFLKIYDLCRQFRAQAESEGFSDTEILRLFDWWISCPRENVFTTGLMFTEWGEDET